jgi:hypothetical protein
MDHNPTAIIGKIGRAEVSSSLLISVCRERHIHRAAPVDKQ